MNTRSIFECKDIAVLKIRYKIVLKQYKLLNNEVQLLTSRIANTHISCLPRTSAYFHELRLSSLRNNRSTFLNLAISIENKIIEMH